MPRLSQSKRDKIAEQLIHYLFSLAPEAAFTATIAKEIARDEEFALVLLKDLEKKKLIISVAKNSQGADYKRRRRWRLSNEVYTIYKKQQGNLKSFSSADSFIEGRDQHKDKV